MKAVLNLLGVFGCIQWLSNTSTRFIVFTILLVLNNTVNRLNTKETEKCSSMKTKKKNNYIYPPAAQHINHETQLICNARNRINHETITLASKVQLKIVQCIFPHARHKSENIKVVVQAFKAE